MSKGNEETCFISPSILASPLVYHLTHSYSFLFCRHDVYTVFLHRDELNPFWMVKFVSSWSEGRNNWKGKELSTFWRWVYGGRTEGWRSSIKQSRDFRSGIRWRTFTPSKKDMKKRLAFLFFFLLISYSTSFFFELGWPLRHLIALPNRAQSLRRPFFPPFFFQKKGEDYFLCFRFFSSSSSILIRMATNF